MDLRLGVLGAAAVLFLSSAGVASAQSPRQVVDALQPISQQRAEEIAATDANAADARREHPDLTTISEHKEGYWQVGFLANGDEIVQVAVSDRGEIRESWTGEQVAWRMARGYEGAFGRKLNSPWIWLPLCGIFVLGLLDWRRPLRWAHLDLLVIVGGFGVSHYFFNRGEIGASVPLAYPPLLYLLFRALWIGFRGGKGWRPSAPIAWLGVATLFLLGFRAGLNIADSNVIDVGLSGVVGADRIADGEALYGSFPEINERGDTYGLVNYLFYVPFEQVFSWSGEWDSLPAAHGAAIFFDLATVLCLFLLGRRLRPGARGRELGIVLAFAWAACPYTAFALESNSNDSLLAALLAATLLVVSSAPGRGALLALASATKFAPLGLAPLLAGYVPGSDASGAGPGRGSRLRTATAFSAAFLVTAGAVMLWPALDPGLADFYDRTLGYQLGRDSPFSIWGQASLGPLHAAVSVLAAGLAILVAFLPRRRDPVTIAALGTAVLVAFQLTADHWFYLYIPWFLPFLFVALAVRSEQNPVALGEPNP